MIILTVRSDKPQAEIGLFRDGEQLAYKTWQAHRELSATLHAAILELLRGQHMDLHALHGIVGFAGPGSFTGLRIGLTVANALAYGLGIPVVATRGDNWIQDGVRSLMEGKSDVVALPEYGSPVHITLPRK